MKNRALIQHIIDTSDIVPAKKQEATEYLAKLEEAAQQSAQADEANRIPSPCPFHLFGTDGVHVVMVDQCSHPKRKEWRERR